jgi:hypothetical protein
MTYWIILCLDTKERDTDSKHGISGSGITVIRSLGRIAPAWALQGAVDSTLELYSLWSEGKLTGRIHASKYCSSRRQHQCEGFWRWPRHVCYSVLASMG